MNIESFVSEALKQIGAGVKSARSQDGITISPKPYMEDQLGNTVAGHMLDSKSQRVVVLIDFDLAVVVKSKIEGDVSAKLEVFSFDFGGGKIEAGIDHTRIQRIKFHVPVTFT